MKISIFITLFSVAMASMVLNAGTVSFFNHSYSHPAECRVEYDYCTFHDKDVVTVPVASGSNPGTASVDTSGCLLSAVYCYSYDGVHDASAEKKLPLSLWINAKVGIGYNPANNTTTLATE